VSDLRNADLSHANLSGANLSGANLNGADLSETDFSDADLSYAILRNTNYDDANLKGADLTCVYLNADRSDMDSIIDNEISEEDPKLVKNSVKNRIRKDFRGADFSHKDLSGKKFCGADFRGADFIRAILVNANFRNAFMTSANFCEANMKGADLGGANLIRADLSDVDLSDATIIAANLKRADLSGANLTDAVLRNVNLTRTILKGADLTRADLSSADLSGTNLRSANLNDTDFTNKDLERSKLNQTPQEIVYSFKGGFDSIDTIAMDYLTVTINNSHPEYNLNLESLTLSGQPKAIFSVAGKDFVEQAKTQIDQLFQIQREKFGIIVDEAVESITKTPRDPDESAIKDDKSGDKAPSVDLNFVCKKCDSSILAYDSYWKEYTCVKCGWIYAGVNLTREKNKPVEIRKGAKSNRSEIHPSDSVFSFSRLNLFKNCPKAYEFKYVLKKEEAFSTIEQHLGKCIHKTLEYAYNEINDRGTPSKKSIMKKYNLAWNASNLKAIKIVKSNLSANNYKSEGVSMLNLFYDHILSNDKSETVELEKYFEIELDSSIGFRGIIDRISWSSNKVLRITDFKTGKRVGNPATDKQLQFYSLWVFDTFKENKIEVCFEDLRNVKTKTAKISRAQILQIEKNLIKDIKRVGAERNFKPKPSILCNWCGYNQICNDVLSFRL